MSERPILVILPALRLRFENSEVWVETYQPRNDAWLPIKNTDYHHVKDGHIKNIESALEILRARVEELKPKPAPLTDEEWDEKVPGGVWVWLREKHPEVGIKTHSDLQTYINDPKNRTMDEDQEQGVLLACAVCSKPSKRTLCEGHHRAFLKWGKKRKNEGLEG